jgi:DNA-directed RNA polymerase specialized sigma subunit
MKTPSRHYVDNKKLYGEMIRYTEQCNQAKAQGLPRPKVPEYIGYAIFKIAEKLASKSNFVNYTYKDDMIADGIETCIRYVDRFDPDKSDKPFSYFTQIIYFAFLQRIQKEKKQTYIKHKVLENSVLMNTLVEMDGEGTLQFDAAYIDLDTDKIISLVEKFEKKKGVKKILDEEDDPQDDLLFTEDDIND